MPSAVSKLSARRDGDALADDEAVDHGLDLVLGLAVERGDLGDFIQRAVDLHAGEAAALQFGEFLAVFALAVAHDGGEQQQAGAFGHRHDAVDHLRDGLRLDRQAGGGRIGHADARPQQAHVVVDLGHRADGGAGVFRGGLLLDGDRRRQAVDAVDVGLAHQFEELAGVGGQRLDVAALALGVDRVERERGFAGAGQAGDHRQRVARNDDVDVLQIMFPRAAHVDVARFGLGHELMVPPFGCSADVPVCHRPGVMERRYEGKHFAVAPRRPSGLGVLSLCGSAPSRRNRIRALRAPNRPDRCCLRHRTVIHRRPGPGSADTAARPPPADPPPASAASAVPAPA